MKFRFCGESDCPDWLLMQINTLSKLTPAQLEDFCGLILQPMLGKEMDYGKLREFSKAASLDGSETKACVSAATQILESGSCHAVSPGDLTRELEQLGLDRAHAQAIGRAYGGARGELTAGLRTAMVTAGRLDGVSASREGPLLRLAFQHTDFAGQASQHQLDMSHLQAHLLLNELKETRSRMEELQSE